MAFLWLLPFIVIIPETIIVPVDNVTSPSTPSFNVFAIVIDAQLKVPAPTAIILFLPVTLPALIVTAPDTVRLFNRLIVNVLEFAPALIVRLLQTAATLTLTLILSLIITTSFEVGTGLFPHVTVLSQLPERDAVLLAP